MELPPPVRRAAVLLAVEGAALAVLGVVYAGAALTLDPASRSSALITAGFAVAAGAGALLLARAVRQLRGWARSPAVVLQLLALPVGLSLLGARIWVAAVPVLGLAGATLYQFATPEARVAFRAE